MARSALFRLVLLAMLGGPVRAQVSPVESLDVLSTPGVLASGSPSTMLERYLRNEASRLLAERQRAVAAIQTPEQVAERQKAMRAFLLDSLGDLPSRTSLNPQVLGTRQGQGYRVERIIFESRPGHHVT